MQGWRVAITAPGRAACERFEVDEARLAPEEVWIRTRFSLISPGTEGAVFANTTGTERYPVHGGYASVGEVVREGADFPNVRRGQAVFTYGAHQEYARARVMCLPVPAGLDPGIAVMARLATVAMTALRVSSVQLGDRVVVLGQGMVGNFCAQLFQRAGAEVLGVDPAPGRRAIAGACGVRNLSPGGDDADIRREVRTFTEGWGADATVEAIGNPRLVELALSLTGKLGEVILLGSPRGGHVTDVTPLLNAVHLWDAGCVTLKGAHEWRHPVQDRRAADPAQKHSMERNTRIAFRMLADGRLQAEPMRTDVASPHEAQAAYEGLRDRRDAHMGVLFDWGEP